MRVGDAIEVVRKRLIFLRTLAALCIFVVAFSFAVVIGLLLARISIRAGYLVCLALLALTISWLWRKDYFTAPDPNEAGAELDKHLQTKERTLSYLQLIDDDINAAITESLIAQNSNVDTVRTEKLGPQQKAERLSKRQLLESQLAPLLENFDPAVSLPFVPSRSLRNTLYSLPVVWLLSGVLYLRFPTHQFTSAAAKAVAEVVEQHPELPSAVQDSLTELAHELDKELQGDSSAAVDEALSNAKREVAEAEAELTKKEFKQAKDGGEESSAGSSLRAGSHTSLAVPPTATPTRTPTPAAVNNSQHSSAAASQSQSEESGEQQGESQKEQGKGGPGHEKPKDDQNSENAQQQQGNQGKNTSGGNGEQQGQKDQQPGGTGSGKSQSAASQSGNSEGKGGSSQGQGGEGRSQGAGQSSGGQNSSGQSQGKEGKEGSQGSDGADGQQGESGQQQGQKQDGKQGQAGSQGAAQGLGAAEKKLEQIEKQRSDQQQNKGENKQAGSAGSQSQDQKGQGGNKGAGKSSDGKEGKGAGGDSAGKSSQPSSSGASSGGAGSEKESKATGKEKGKQTSSQPQQKDRPNSQEKSGESGAALGGPGGEAKRFEDGNGKWPGLGNQKDFKNAEIQAQESSVDPRFAGAEGNLEKNNQPAKFKTGLPDATMAKPDAVKEGGEQPIPLEYRDLLQ